MNELNDFGYFTRIEEYVRQCGRAGLLSPREWVLIEKWKEMGIPLHVVLRAVDRVSRRLKRPFSLSYCEPIVMEEFSQHQHARIGAREGSDGAPPPSPFSREMTLEYLERGRAELRRLADERREPEFGPLREAIERVIGRLDALREDVRMTEAVDFETLERELVRLERILYEALLQGLPEERVAQVRAEGQRQLKEHRKRMSEDLYEQTLQNYVAKRLREEYGLPRLSLFYL